MYKPGDITTNTQLAGWLRCSVNDISRLRQKENSIIKFKIPKKNPKNGYREVYKAEDYLLCNTPKCLKFELSKLYEPLECVGGFIPGRNIAYNAKFHLNKNVVINLDIKNFFESIPFERVIEAFELLGFHNNIATLLADIVTYNKILVAGFNTSPIIANIVCSKMDKELSAICKDRNINYTRYADDLSFSSMDNIESDTLEKIITKYGFTLNTEKTRIYKRGRSQYVTGLTVADKTMPRIPRRIKKNLRAAIYYIRIYGLSSHIEHKYGISSKSQRIRNDSFCRKEAAEILGWIHYINGIEPIFASKCSEELKKITNRNDISYFKNADLYIRHRK